MAGQLPVYNQSEQMLVEQVPDKEVRDAWDSVNYNTECSGGTRHVDRILLGTSLVGQRPKGRCDNGTME